jgi:hypothetical protein
MSAKLMPTFADREVPRGHCDGSLRPYSRISRPGPKSNQSHNYTECGRNNSHNSKNHCGVPKADSGVWSIPLGRVHNKVFSCRHAVVE